jgi:hypothetical protein
MKSHQDARSAVDHLTFGAKLIVICDNLAMAQLKN